MSVAAMSWVFQHSDERLGRRLVLLALADRAADDGTGAYESVETIARKARLSRSQVQRCLRELEKAGAVIRHPELSRYGTHIYDVVLRGPQYATPAANRTAEGPQIGPGAEADLRPDPSLEQPIEQPPLASLAERAREAPLRVNRKAVTMEEHRLALDILRSWNEQSGQRLSGNGWLKDIVGRIREEPSLELADHEHLIRLLLTNNWGEGKPTPNMIYGNEKAFRVAVAKAAAGPREDPAARAMRIVKEGRSAS